MDKYHLSSSVELRFIFRGKYFIEGYVVWQEYVTVTNRTETGGNNVMQLILYLLSQYYFFHRINEKQEIISI